MSKHSSMPPSSSSSSSLSLSSSSSRRAASKRTPSGGKQLMFSHVEVIPDRVSNKSARPAATGAVSHSSSKLKRSPTPVLTSLTDLTNAHFHQLSTVWNEQSLPSFESDKRAIAATRQGDKDPFDF